MNNKILITSFDTFQGSYNSSRRLASAYFEHPRQGCEHLQLSVNDKGVQLLSITLNSVNPDGVILMGEHSGIQKLRLETKANPIPLSLVSSSSKLNRLLLLLHGPIHCLFFYLEHHSWFVKGPCQSMASDDLEIKDTHLNYFYCNASYRAALHWADKQNPKRPVAFLHVPKKEHSSDNEILTLERIVTKMKETVRN